MRVYSSLAEHSITDAHVVRTIAFYASQSRLRSSSIEFACDCDAIRGTE